MDELKRFEADLKNNEELKRKFEEALKRQVEGGEAQSEGEVMVRAAKELGYDISIAALEQTRAEAEELDPEALKDAAGGDDGVGGYDHTRTDNCWKEYLCAVVNRTSYEDLEGHDTWCITAWHCYAATLHTEGGTEKEKCWSDYKCVLVNK